MKDISKKTLIKVIIAQSVKSLKALGKD